MKVLVTIALICAAFLGNAQVAAKRGATDAKLSSDKATAVASEKDPLDGKENLAQYKETQLRGSVLAETNKDTTTYSLKRNAIAVKRGIVSKEISKPK